MQKYDPPYTNCPVCQSSNIVFNLKDLRANTIFKCQDCHVQFMNPVYSDEYLTDYYSKYIPEEISEKLRQLHTFVTNDNFKAVNTVVKSKGLFLDFGSGDGTHAAYAKEQGWDVIAYDVDEASTSNIKQRFNVEAVSGDFFKIDWNGRKFNLVYANQVIEHLKQPVKYLAQLKSILDEHGYLFIAVPNISSLSNRFKRFLEKLNIRRKNIGNYYDTSHHVFYFDPISMQNLLKQSGFEVVYLRNCRKPTPGNSWLKKIIDKYVVERFLSTSTFLLLAKKSDIS